MLIATGILMGMITMAITGTSTRTTTWTKTPMLQRTPPSSNGNWRRDRSQTPTWPGSASVAASYRVPPPSPCCSPASTKKPIALGVVMVAAFSIGLALMLVAIGVLAAWGAKALAARQSGLERFTRWAPYASAAVVLIIGLLVTAQGLAALKVV